MRGMKRAQMRIDLRVFRPKTVPTYAKGQYEQRPDANAVSIRFLRFPELRGAHLLSNGNDRSPILDREAQMRICVRKKNRHRADPTAHVGYDRVPRKLVPGETCG